MLHSMQMQSSPPVNALHAKWFKTIKTGPQVRQRIFCLPHAGGAASQFRKWAEAIPADTELIAIQYPGREERVNETCLQDMPSLIDALSKSLCAQPHLLKMPYILFGHSMGAAVAYELCASLQNNNQRLPCHLVLSASEGPGHINVTSLHRASDQALLEEIIRLNSDLVYLTQMPELTELILPSLRGDYRLIETYGATSLEIHRIHPPVTIMVGEQDRELSEDDARTWSQITARDMGFVRYPGDHFYLNQQYPAMIAVMLGYLKQHQQPVWLSVP
ncbi:thioesterase II family protein [Photobacterium sanguinicancri]|uniref:thioesterase II family protein n=1 Tax=Photobacterium sanguinicancri TaxID=875932 RepID=UPI0026E472DE|nr:alpha/beta fold hydrolase [Photobacterium sanguinicancri]MDO6496566.1 alpha/beta fold hydrolase [Photobacterium sanguinicancri]